VLHQVDWMLSRFDRRPDLQVHRDAAYSASPARAWFPFFYRPRAGSRPSGPMR
jgi:hypothetical protein